MLWSEKYPYLFINADAAEGEIRVVILDESGNIIPSFARAIPVTGDSCKMRIQWEDEKDIRSLLNQPIRLRFDVKKARIYAFWFSPSEKGESLGYMGAGGPGFKRGRDM